MLLSENDIEEFRNMCRELLNRELSVEEAHDQALRLLTVVEVLEQPNGSRQFSAIVTPPPQPPKAPARGKGAVIHEVTG